MASQADVLAEQLHEAIASREQRAARLKRSHFSLRLSVMLLGGTSTVLLGWNATPDDKAYLVWSRNAALVLGALVTLLSGLAAFWQLEQYWLRTKVQVARLRGLETQLRLSQAQPSGVSPQESAAQVEQFLAILGIEGEYWEESRDAINPTRIEERKSTS